MGTANQNDDLREVLLVVRRALLLVVRWIEQRYKLTPRHRKRNNGVSSGIIKRD